MLIPYGVDRLPRDVSLRSVQVGDAPLRLNSEPVPPDAMPLVVGDHTARVAAAVAWLHSLCGDYAPLRRQFIDAYFRWLAAEIAAHRARLAARLRLYDGLYAPEDFLWSALRPLPRGWVPVGQRWLPADMVFWDGERALAVELGARETERERALRAAGVAVIRAAADAPEGLAPVVSGFADQQVLPASPFRRPFGW